MFRIWKYVFALLLMLLTGGAIWYIVSREKNAPEAEVLPGEIAELKGVVELCSMEFYNETPVLDTINNKVLFGLQKQCGSISFDVENLKLDPMGDTLRIVMPKEKIEIYESTEPGSWKVIDTQNLSLFGSDRLTPEEENILKQRAIKRARARLYTEGRVDSARAEATRTLRVLLERITNRPIEIKDR